MASDTRELPPKKNETPLLMSFGDHLEELRRYIIRIIAVLFVAFIILFINKEILFGHIILAPKESTFLTNSFMCQIAQKLDVSALCINKNELQLINIQLAGQFTAHILVALIGAIILAFPFILWQLWLFVKPGLYAREIQKFKRFIGVSSVLFFTGVFFAYFIIVPLAINFLGNYKVDESVVNTISLMSFITSVSLITLAMGIVFQMPVMVYFFTKIGWLSPELMQKNRKIVFIILLILSAIITPPDVFSQLLVVFPLYLLFEISIIISKKHANYATKTKHPEELV